MNTTTLPFTLHLGDCLDVLRSLPDNSVDSVVTDPPYGIRFMGKAWDGKDIEARAAYRDGMPSAESSCGPSGGHRSVAAEAGKYDLTPAGMRAFQAFTLEWAGECLRVLKPGGHLLSFAAARTYHHMAVGIEMAGFEIRDQIMWVFGSGFPKSHNLKGDHAGWGTALKPAHEPICMARKPLVGTVLANVTAFGTGAMNIDACRVATGEDTARISNGAIRGGNFGAGSTAPGPLAGGHDAGRWPANLIHDGSPAVIAAFPDAPGQQGDLKGHSKDRKSTGIYGDMAAARDATARLDSGSAARFFYCAKTSRRDRNEGLVDPGPQFKRGTTLRMVENTDTKGNNHPTVKPTELMAYLLRLVTPVGGCALDPFLGSGSTGKAAMQEGFQFIGIEMEAPYMAIASARIRHAHAAAQVAADLADALARPAQADLFGMTA